MPSYKDEKTNKWYCQFYYKDWTGARKHKTKRGFARKKDADEWERKFKNTEQKQELYLYNLLDEYEKHLDDRLDLGTIKRNSVMSTKEKIKLYIKPFFPDVSISKITTNKVNEWIVTLSNTESRRKQKLASKTVNSVRQILSQVFEYARKYHNFANNPVTYAEKVAFRSTDTRAKLWTPEEYNTFYNSLDKDLHKCFYNLLFYGGLRRGEALALTPADITPYKVTINKTFNFRGKVKFMDTPKTKTSNREVDIPEFLYNQLVDYAKKYEVPDNESMFASFYRYCELFLRRRCEKLNLPMISPHILRHSYGSIVYNITKDLATVSKLMGHSSPTTTLAIYTHSLEGEGQKAAEKLQKLVKPDENKLKLNSTPDE